MRVHRHAVATILAVLFGGSVCLHAQTTPPLETELARLPRLGTIAYITAHPDDESPAVITYLARGLHARVVILCLTRGEGGQDVNGPELGEELARIRTGELERAAAGYGAEVRFLGAEDFGYSKSVEETLTVWGEEKIMGELVRQIRALRPLVVISRWTGTAADGGGAHHRAAGVLARRAFALVGDPKAFPEQLAHGYQLWQPRVLLIHTNTPEEGRTFEVPVQEASPVAGKSYEELGWAAFQNHRSQGLHLIELPRGRHYYLRMEATPPPDVRAPTSAAELVPDLATLPDLFPAVPSLADWRGRLAQVVSLAEDARRLQQEDKRSEAALALVQGAGLLTALGREIPGTETDQEANAVRALLEERQNEFLKAAAALAGVELEALTDRATLTPGESVWVRLRVRVSAPEVFRAVGFSFATLRLETPPDWPVEPAEAETTADEQRAEFVVRLPEKLDPTRAAGAPLGARAALTTGSLRVELTAPVRGLARGGQGEPALEPVSVAPAVTLELEPPLRLLPATPGETTRDWCVQLEAHRPQLGKISVWFDVPNGWYTPLPQETTLAAAGQQARLCFSLTIPEHVPPGHYELRATAGRGTETFALARYAGFSETDAVRYRYEPAQTRVEILDLDVPPGLHIGYIGFNSDPEPALLAQLGIGVDMLDERALASARLADYDAIVIANRAYDFREDLAGQTQRLLDYVRAGGTLVVEHQGSRWDPAHFAPYPATKPSNRNLRVTDETAPVRVLAPEHPLLNFPNRIGEDDWKGWVQERGLYFWESWSENYTPLVGLADPSEDPQRGALLVAHYGKGQYIYCGLALFRQVRAGVAGGVRLYINLLSQGRAVKPAAAPGENPER